jgi:hypothetical protein
MWTRYCGTAAEAGGYRENKLRPVVTEGSYLLENADWVDMEWVTEDVTKSEVQQSWRIVVLCIQKVPLQAFFSLPGGSVLRFCM